MFLVILALVVAAHAHRHHPRFPQQTYEDDQPLFTKSVCTSETEFLRNQILEKTHCGTPKEVFIELQARPMEQISPGVVWIKRCVGMCHFHQEQPSHCGPTKTVIRHIPVRVYNLETGKDSCATFPVEEHTSCGCCAGAEAGACARRKCARRRCKPQKNQSMRWNRSKCRCEPRKRPQMK